MAILTISRQYGSGGREVGRAVAELMGYEYIDKERMLADIRALGGRWERWGSDMDEHCPTLWERYDWSFMAFAAALQSHILGHALRGDCVIMGRGGNFLLAGVPHALRVRITAPLEARVERVMARESIDRESARRLIEKIDNERACFIRGVYHGNWDDPASYDMAIDTAEKAVEDAAALLKDALLERERMKTPGAVRALETLALAARVRAGILTDPRFLVPTLQVYPEEETIVLKGVVHSPEEHRALEEEARRIAGGAPVRCDLRYRLLK